MIQVFDDNKFILHTQNTSYAFRVLETGQLEHLYYGKRIKVRGGEDFAPLCEKFAFPTGNTNAYDQEHLNITLENMCLEMSGYGKGDIWEPFVELVHKDGSSTCDFLFDSYEIIKGKEDLKTLPSSYDDEDKVETLCITMRDSQYDIIIKLYYYVFEECDVISRSAKLINSSSEQIALNRLMSTCLDMQGAGFVFTTFNGSWAREMKRSDNRLLSGKHINASFTGTSSSRANPFVMLSKGSTSEDAGEVYGLNLIYSGNHYECAEVTSYNKTRLVCGINPAGFSFVLEAGDEFEAPEAVMTYSDKGFNSMSANMHHFVREHIVRGSWKKKPRPVLLNSWEAAYFDINEKKLLNLAKAGKEVGIELFVMDDGWFGNRNDDTTSLGDWWVNEKKLPGGLKGLCDKIKALGLDFGIWVEPEMVNVKSKLYEEHPDWVLMIPGKPHSEGRNQRILDLTNPLVCDFIIEKMSEVFASADISYVKWDMNRTFTDVFSQSLPANRQGEVFHRYVCGLYRCMKELTNRFPNILFEGCCSGGNRFDLGILSYFPQIWASDDTDAMCRAEMQHNYSYGYPMSTVGAHVSACPNHQTLRNTPLETRFAVASFGVFGYECNLCDMKSEDRAAIKAQIEIYKKFRDTLQFGSFYRGKGFAGEGVAGSRDGVSSSMLRSEDGNLLEWTCVSKDKSRAVAMLLQKNVIPNNAYTCFKPKGLDEEQRYHFYNRALKVNVKNFGDLVNTASPIHIKQNSLMQDLVAKFVKMDGETEDVYAYGDLLMNNGVKLKQAFAATGYDKEVRYFQDYGARLYFMEVCD